MEFAEIECFIEPPAEVKLGADLLDEALEAWQAGRRDDAVTALRKLDTERFRWAYYEGAAIAEARRDPRLHPKTVAKELRDPRHLTAALRRAVAERDGWRCQYCGLRVVSGKVLSALGREFPDELSDSPDFAWHMLRYTPDHVLSHACGGTNDEKNLVASCGTCQSQKSDCSIEELRLVDPRHRVRILDGWNGLTGKFGL